MTAFGMADFSEWRPFGMAGRHQQTLHLIQEIGNNKNIEDIQRRHLSNAITLKFIGLYYILKYLILGRGTPVQFK